VEVKSPVKFLLNDTEQAQDNAVVESNAFSLTKVLAAGAIIIGPIAAGIVDALSGLEAQDWVVLAVALLGFLAITASADIIGRSVASAAKLRADGMTAAADTRAGARGAVARTRADAAVAAIASMTPFQQPLAGHRIARGEDPAIDVLAAASGGYFLVREDDSLTWLKEEQVRIP
jgi:hypothetical protein